MATEEGLRAADQARPEELPEYLFRRWGLRVDPQSRAEEYMYDIALSLRQVIIELDALRRLLSARSGKKSGG